MILGMKGMILRIRREWNDDQKGKEDDDRGGREKGSKGEVERVVV